MDLPLPEPPPDPAAQARRDRRRLRNALLASAGFVALLAWIKMLEVMLERSLVALAVFPREPFGLVGVLGAPLLHGSFEHLAANSLALLVLGTLAGVLYPRAALRSLLLIWLGSGLFVWLFGRANPHLGASGLTHGLMLFVFVSGVLRRDRPAIAGAMIAFFLYGGMLLTVLPREAGISWESHLGGALMGVLAALLWRRLDPAPARKRYSWEDEVEEPDPETANDPFEPPRPREVPVLWQRPDPQPERRGVVLRFPGNRHDPDPPTRH